MCQDLGLELDFFTENISLRILRGVFAKKVLFKELAKSKYLKFWVQVPLFYCQTSVVGNRATQDTSQKSQGNFFLSFLCTLFLYF